MICEADKGYDSRAFRQALLNKGYVPIIGYRKHIKERVSTEEIANYFGVTQKRWVVERTVSFSWLKRKCRRLFLRWERLPILWDAFSKMGLIFMWLNYLLG